MYILGLNSSPKSHYVLKSNEVKSYGIYLSEKGVSTTIYDQELPYIYEVVEFVWVKGRVWSYLIATKNLVLTWNKLFHHINDIV